ncbi:hypoxia up-regulated Grp170 co-chaperone protein isoform X2 [Oratosquilla oratoria]
MGATKWGLIPLAITVAVVSTASAVTIMSIDFGSEWYKVAVVAPGVPMEISLNKESKRKTPVTISFRDGERTFGDDALTAGIRNPSTTYFYLLDLLGKTVDNPIVEVYKKRFPYYNIEGDPDRNTVVFVHDEETKFTVEELVAQILTNAKEEAMGHTGQRIKDVVITVPAFFNQAERRAILSAAEMTGMKVLSLMNSNTAVALNYGMFRRKEINETIQHILFYDMGASSTTASIVSYQTIKTKDRGYTETNPQLNILGIGYDRTLGGLEMQLRLRDFLATKFNEMKKTSSDVFKSGRAMAKFMKEAGRLKNILSANSDYISQVEGVIDEQDFRLHVTREDFEKLCLDLFERVRAPVDAALRNAAMDLKDIGQFIIVGGNTRVPRIQSILQNIWGKELGKNINADEAAAMGAIYRGADLGQGFKVKKFHVKDAVIFPLEIYFQRNGTSDEKGSWWAAVKKGISKMVDFDRTVETDDGKTLTKSVKRSLFAVANNYPQKKVMTFNKHTADFDFAVNYGDTSHLPKQEVLAAKPVNVSLVSVTGVTEAFEKQLKDGAESKGIKAHFSMDDSGILSLVNVEAVFEKNITEEVEEEEESTLSKLGSTISKLFSGSEDEKKDDKDKEKEAGGESESDTESEKKEKKDKDKTSDKGKNGDSAKETKKEEKKKKEMKPKLVVVKEELNFTEARLDFPDLTPEQMKTSVKRVENINKAEKARKEKEAARNTLESYILDAQDKLWQEEYEAASTDDERTKIREMCSQLDEWIYEDGFDEEASVYKEKLSALEKLVEPIKERVHEHRERPEALQALRDMINASSTFMQRAQEPPPEERWFTEVELQSMEKLIVDTEKWLETKEEEQEKTPLYETPKLPLSGIGEKIGALDREIKYLVNKARLVKAKKEREAAEAKIKAEKEAKEKEEKAKKTKKANNTEEEEKEKEEVVVEDQEEGAKVESAEEQEEKQTDDTRQEPVLPEEPYNFEEGSEENDSEVNKRKNGEEILDEPTPTQQKEPHTEL